MAPNGRFRRLETIREAFASFVPVTATINGQFKSPNTDIISILANPDLRKLNLVRNVIVHKSGIVDGEFLTEAGKIDWIVSDQENQPIQINGRRVRELVSPVVQAGESLIRAVDHWITLHKQKAS